MKGALRRTAIGFAVGVVVVSTLALPAAADTTGQSTGGPILVVYNPSPGDVLPRGKQYFYGRAYHPAATSGIGVDRVQVFAGDRDAGGFWLGTALTKADAAKVLPETFTGTLGLLNVAALGTQWERAGWRIKTQTALKKTMNGSLFFYARSSVNGKETVVTVGGIKIDPGRGLSAKP